MREFLNQEYHRTTRASAGCHQVPDIDSLSAVGLSTLQVLGDYLKNV